MKSTLFPLIILLLMLAACSNDQHGRQPDSLFTKSKTELRSFSDTTKLDTFKIMLKGDQPRNMELVFTITRTGGDQIYSKILKGKDLLDNYKETLDLGKEKKQIQFLEEEMSLFFEEENFIEPAVTDTEEPDKNTPDKNFFSELKQSSLNGFKYRLGKESKVYIAWSEKEKKVKIYYQCCKL